ncbi:hypothetical protein GCM10022220_62600 [Actinocatenispora rupis]|uniref:Uncharacterized protein n=1 Tax=Actinocatenispora rupis TaxID=519421 RepID=A0A8J3J636_9ACTN|nr:hypothetical protein Aru02nite_63840 [Actinocatenispora rupis]
MPDARDAPLSHRYGGAAHSVPGVPGVSPPDRVHRRADGSAESASANRSDAYSQDRALSRRNSVHEYRYPTAAVRVPTESYRA